jgi:hypothetical protein
MKALRRVKNMKLRTKQWFLKFSTNLQYPSSLHSTVYLSRYLTHPLTICPTLLDHNSTYLSTFSISNELDSTLSRTYWTSISETRINSNTLYLTCTFRFTLIQESPNRLTRVVRGEDEGVCTNDIRTRRAEPCCCTRSIVTVFQGKQGRSTDSRMNFKNKVGWTFL